MVALREWGAALGTRNRGEVVRRELEQALDDDPTQVVVVSFEGVQRVSPSFADECFGKLALKLGTEGVRKRLRFAAAENAVASVVMYAIRNRLISGGIEDAPDAS